ncbi:MAG: FkbM family methyltransferase [Myxococcota bacterium]
MDAEIAGRQVTLSYPDAPGLRPFVESVLAGLDYPIVFPGVFEASTIVDIGAHAGAATVFLKSHYPDAEVLAFEPSSVAYAHLCSNVRDLPGVQTRRAALGGRDGDAKLYTGLYSSMQNSLKPNEENREAYETVLQLDAHAAFDALERDVFSIVKIDTEGCELEILDSIRPLLPAIEVVYLEYHSEADRLAIDRRLCPGFVLYAARADEPHRGTNSYVRADVFARCSARLEQRYVFPKESGSYRLSRAISSSEDF